MRREGKFVKDIICRITQNRVTSVKIDSLNAEYHSRSRLTKASRVTFFFRLIIETRTGSLRRHVRALHGSFGELREKTTAVGSAVCF